MTDMRWNRKDLLSLYDLSREEIEALVEERRVARQTKNYARGDELRDQLKVMGIQLRDSVDGTDWEVDK